MELVVSRPRSRIARADWLHRFCLAAVTGLGIKIKVHGLPPPRGALICNHLSYLDIIVFAASQPCVFCSKAEVRDWPVIGWMTTMSGTVYVERGRGGSAARAASGMRAAIDAGLPVVFFPEGTTSNGDDLLPFRSGLLAQTMADDIEITAASLDYTLDGRNGPSDNARDHICWGDDTPLFRHAFHLLGLKGIGCHIHFAEAPIVFSSPGINRKAAAVEARQAVLAIRSSEGWR